MRARGRALSSCRPFGTIVTWCLSVPEQWRTGPRYCPDFWDPRDYRASARYHLICIRGDRLSRSFCARTHKYAYPCVCIHEEMYLLLALPPAILATLRKVKGARDEEIRSSGQTSFKANLHVEIERGPRDRPMWTIPWDVLIKPCRTTWKICRRDSS